jgi:uncharacterized membrane protein YbhN (UPF0104 family)
MMAEAGRPWTKRALRWGIAVLVIGIVGYFFASALWDNWDEVAAAHLAFDWWWLLAILLFAVAVPLTGLLWARILRLLSPQAQVSNREAIVLQCVSWLLKYIPGQVGAVVNKVVWAGKKGVSRSLVIVTFIYENVFLQLASIVPAVAILLVSLGSGFFGDNATLLVLPLLILIPLALVAYKPFFHRIVSVLGRRLLHQDLPESYFLGTFQALRFAIEFIGPRVLNGVGFVVLASTVSAVSPSEWLPFGAAYVLAGAIGILAFFVPSGLGVREAVIVLVLSRYVPTAEAIVISLLARLLSTIGDAVVALFYVGLRRSIPKEFRP